MSTAKQKMTTHAASYALYNCGAGVIDYTRGVLDALGQEDLSYRLASAARALKAATETRNAVAAQHSDPALAQFGMTQAPQSLEDAQQKAQADLDAIFREVEALKQEITAL
jgi:hypothetical protein